MSALEFAKNFFAELHRRNPLLSRMGWANLALLFAAGAAAPFDPRTITGINPWIKPMKFAASVAIFVFTMGWLLEHVRRYRRTVSVVSWGVAVVFAVEQACIFMQAARGTTSHFNVRSSAFNAAVFATMGLMIVVNTALVLVVLYLFFRRPVGDGPLAPAYLWGIRLGLVIFVAASLQGFAMTSQLAHTVGAPDGGPGLPFLSWSTRAGDLRVAHSLGLHALQVLPLVGFAFSRRGASERTHQVAYTVAFAALYAAAFALLFWQAMLGRPLLALAD
jgi:hypothetical protein